MKQAIKPSDGAKFTFVFSCIVFALLIVLQEKSNAQNRKVDAFPIPVFTAQTQFYLQRTTDANTVMYDLNFKNGVLNEKEPIKAYWIRYTEKGVKKELTGIQKKYAFGLRSTKLNNGTFKIIFAAYSKVPLYLKKQHNGVYKTSVTLDGKEIVLDRLYIHIEPGGSFWSPNVSYIEFKGKEASSGKAVSKQIVTKS